MLLESSTIVVGSSSRKRTATRADDQRQLPTYYFKKQTQSEKDIFARLALKCFAGCNIPFRDVENPFFMQVYQFGLHPSIINLILVSSIDPFTQ
jgi:hypothetical protein